MEQPNDLKTSFVDQRWFERLLEIFPGTISWLFLIGPVVLSLVDPVVVAYFIIASDLLWMGKALRMSYHLITGYRQLSEDSRVDWLVRLEGLNNPEETIRR